MRRLAIFLFVPMLFLSAHGNASGGIIYNGKKTKDYQAFMEYSLIFLQLTAIDRPIPELVEKTYPKIIGEYKEFLKKYPESHLVDDVKLRIAEFYQLMGTAAQEDILKRKMDTPENWRKEAVGWLLDIVANHSEDKEFHLYPPSDPRNLNIKPSPRESGEYTAAYALYYLFSWDLQCKSTVFAGKTIIRCLRNKKYLNILISRYPKSEAAVWARDILKRIKQTEQRKQKEKQKSP